METGSFLNDPRHWRERAEEARSRADQIAEPQSKIAMLRIAHDYEVLAERAEARAWGHSLKSD
jgi:predicted kinase